MIKRILCFTLALLLLCATLPACSDEKDAGSLLLSFSQAQSVEDMKEYDGKSVTIIGYMSTLSPISGKFMYLMNLPYQSCPFCVPNTTQLSNTMAVYAKGSDEFEFTDRAIQVTGKLEFGDYTDEFGYEYSYRIVDATYSILDTSNMSEELRLWQQLASTDVIADVYSMFEYVNFTCFWPTYTMQFEGGSDYLYPSDAIMLIETEGAQFNYGYKSGYFDAMINTIKAVDENAFNDLISIIIDAKALSARAYDELKAESYSVYSEYGATFNDGRSQYRMDSDAEFSAEMQRIYSAFSVWIASWEI